MCWTQIQSQTNAHDAVSTAQGHFWGRKYRAKNSSWILPGIAKIKTKQKVSKVKVPNMKSNSRFTIYILLAGFAKYYYWIVHNRFQLASNLDYNIDYLLTVLENIYLNLFCRISDIAMISSLEFQILSIFLEKKIYDG